MYSYGCHILIYLRVFYVLYENMNFTNGMVRSKLIFEFCGFSTKYKNLKFLIVDIELKLNDKNLLWEAYINIK